MGGRRRRVSHLRSGPLRLLHSHVHLLHQHPIPPGRALWEVDLSAAPRDLRPGLPRHDRKGDDPDDSFGSRRGVLGRLPAPCARRSKVRWGSARHPAGHSSVRRDRRARLDRVCRDLVDRRTAGCVLQTLVRIRAGFSNEVDSVGLLTVGTAGAAVLSIVPLPWAPNVPFLSLATSSQVRTLPSIDLLAISCSTGRDCLAAGDRQGRNVSRDAIVLLHNGVWSSPTVLAGPTSALPNDLQRLACASSGTCVSTGIDQARTLPIATDEHGRWGDETLSIPGGSRYSGLLGVATSCSPGGMCWVIVNQLNAPQWWSYAVGIRGGHWLAPYRIGGRTLRIRGRPVAAVISRYVSCWSESSCTVLGLASSRHGNSSLVFLQTERNGRWAPPTMLPESTGNGFFPWTSIGESTSVSCTSNSDCLVSGAEDPTMTKVPSNRRWTVGGNQPLRSASRAPRHPRQSLASRVPPSTSASRLGPPTRVWISAVAWCRSSKSNVTGAGRLLP